jgi:hypothetical protein
MLIHAFELVLTYPLLHFLGAFATPPCVRFEATDRAASGQFSLPKTRTGGLTGSFSAART